MVAPLPASSVDFTGMTVADAVPIVGRPYGATRAWLIHKGYRLPGDVCIAPTNPLDIQDEIARRLAAAPPSAPCWRCGARAGCEHRP